MRPGSAVYYPADSDQSNPETSANFGMAYTFSRHSANISDIAFGNLGTAIQLPTVNPAWRIQTLGDTLPSAPGDYFRNSANGDAELISNGLIAQVCLGQPANFFDCLLGELGIAVGFSYSKTKDAPSVKSIPLARGVLQIIDSVVGLDPVFVVDFELAGSKKSSSDYAMDVLMLLAAIFGEFYVDIAAPVVACPENKAPCVPNAAAGGNVVNIFVSDNWLPDFVHYTTPSSCNTSWMRHGGLGEGAQLSGATLAIPIEL